MLLRPFKNHPSTQQTHRIRYSDAIYDFAFAPFTEQNQNQLPDRSYIKKTRKILQYKQQSLLNRIKVIKKEEEKILKRKENQFRLFVKLQTTKRNHTCLFSQDKSPKNYTSTTNQSSKIRKNTHLGPTKRTYHQSVKSLPNQQLDEKFTAEKLFLEKIQNAKRLKQQKTQNQVKITKQRAVELSRKLQSAGMVRKNRQKVKQTRENFYRSRQQSIKHLKQEKMQQERLKFIEIQRHIKTLEREQIEALRHWKKIAKDDECQFMGLKGLEIGEANYWLE